MASDILDTALEAELRALVFFFFLLDEPVTADYLGILDTLTVNQRVFHIGADDLNGTHRLACGELQTRTELMNRALKQLTLQRLTNYDQSATPAGFRISETGARLVNQLRNDYANRFFAAALDTLEVVGDATTTQLAKFINTTPLSEVRS